MLMLYMSNSQTKSITKDGGVIMEVKDWILLLVPIFCNGIIIFILQKIFEKRQISRTIKFEYGSLLRKKIDLSLELHAKATRLANEGNKGNETIINEILQQYVNSILDVYYYYVPNKVVFEAFNNNMENIAALISELIKYSKQEKINIVAYSNIFNKIRDELMAIKKGCIKLRF